MALLGVVFVSLKTNPVKYCMELDTDHDSKSVTIQVPFRTAVANKIFHILPRAAFLDSRNRGHHSNTTVILAQMSKSILSSPLCCNSMVIACKIGDYVVKSLEVRSLQINTWLHRVFPKYTHEDVMIFCYNVPASPIGELNNSVVSVVYF